MHIIVGSRTPEVVEAIAGAFDERDHRLTVCESGLEVLAAAEVVEADLLILDMQTPGLNGPLLISAIRELAPRLSIVAISTKPSLDARAVSHTGVVFATLPLGSDGGTEALLAALPQAGSSDSPRPACSGTPRGDTRAPS